MSRFGTGWVGDLVEYGKVDDSLVQRRLSEWWHRFLKDSVPAADGGIVRLVGVLEPSKVPTP